MAYTVPPKRNTNGFFPSELVLKRTDFRLLNRGKVAQDKSITGT